MSDGPHGGPPAKRRAGRVLIGVGIALIAIAVVRMNIRALGGPPEHPGDFSERRTQRQVRAEVHAGFPEFVAFALGGFGLVILGAHLGRGDD